MVAGGFIFESVIVRRALALLAFAAVLFFAAGGSLLHQHTNGSEEAACPICQALHMPALAAARIELVSSLRIVIRTASVPQHAAPSKSFSLHRAGRAPPTV